jgi:hypothetical protein
MLISSRSPPPLPSYPTPITTIGLPSIGNGVKIMLKITIGGDKSRRWFDGGGAKRGWFEGGGVLQDGSFYSGGGGGEADSSDQQKFWRIMSSCHLFASCAHSSSAGAKLKKELLRQYLYLGLPGVLTKQLSTGACIAWGRMCKGDDLDDRVLMPKIVIIERCCPSTAGWSWALNERIFSMVFRPKNEKRTETF